MPAVPHSLRGDTWWLHCTVHIRFCQAFSSRFLGFLYGINPNVSWLEMCPATSPTAWDDRHARSGRSTRKPYTLESPGVMSLVVIAPDRAENSATCRSPSVVTSKPAMRGRLKTGHGEGPKTLFCTLPKWFVESPDLFLQRYEAT